jgi:phosphoribosylaminoimidazole-succinocarboxamide synthase
MNIYLHEHNSIGSDPSGIVPQLARELGDLGFPALVAEHLPVSSAEDLHIQLVSEGQPSCKVDGVRSVALEGEGTLLERILKVVPLDFEALPLVFEGESKEVRLWTEKVAVMRFKPTVYSYTINRYGEVAGTEVIRLTFSAALFRLMADTWAPVSLGAVPKSAFLAEIEATGGPFLVQRKIEPCNLEVRIKRYHVGSPVHRYLYTERYPSTQTCGPLRRWSRLDEPVVCFDWRHPLLDDQGNRLADEPISDDYARVWMYNLDHAKDMARCTFLWMEALFEVAGMRLIDMCLLIDRQGQLIYGEISPDCMRVHLGLDEPNDRGSSAKDVWRLGGSPTELRWHYENLFSRLFKIV